MKISKKSAFLITLLLSTQTLALVDYSETTDEPVGPAKVIRPKVVPRPGATSVATTSTASNYSPSGMFFLQTEYGNQSVNAGERKADVQTMKFYGHFETNYNIFVDATYMMLQTSDSFLAKDSGWQSGNPQVLVGLNWLRFGAPSEMASVDFLGGVRTSSSSELGSSRLDKIVGVETSKRFNMFALGIGYELNLTGSASNEDEMHIGNIQNLKASLGWQVSPDIRFALDGGTVTIGKSDDQGAKLTLDEDVKYSYISPKLNLTLGPVVNLTMGATFRTRRAKDEISLTPAKLWHLPGLYGNALFAGLELAI